MADSTCALCDIPYTPANRAQKYCSPTCRQRAQYAMANRVPCQRCGKPTGYKVGVVATATHNTCRVKLWEHGTRKGYREHACRCDACSEWNRKTAEKYQARRRAGHFAMTPCSEAECERGATSRGMCTMHYKRWARANGMVKNPPWDDKARNKYHRRRARLNNGTNSDRVFLADIIARDGTDCRGCSQPVDLALAYPHPMSKSLDHVVPISRGGHHSMANGALMHLRCNLSKGSRLYQPSGVSDDTNPGGVHPSALRS